MKYTGTIRIKSGHNVIELKEVASLVNSYLHTSYKHTKGFNVFPAQWSVDTNLTKEALYKEVNLYIYHYVLDLIDDEEDRDEVEDSLEGYGDFITVEFEEGN